MWQLWKVRIGGGVSLVMWPLLAHASTLTEMQDVASAVDALVAIFYLIGGLIVVAIGIYAITKFMAGREHLVEGSVAMAGAFIVGIFMWRVIPLVQKGVIANAAAATLEAVHHEPPAIVQVVEPPAYDVRWEE